MKTLKLFILCSFLCWLGIYLLISLTFGDFTMLFERESYDKYTFALLLMGLVVFEVFLLILIWPVHNKFDHGG